MTALLDDLPFFFDGLDAQDVRVRLTNGEERTIRAYFDAPYQAHELGVDYTFQTADYALTCMAADVADFECDRTTVVIDGAEYVVAAVKSDGAGLAEVVLTNPAEVVVEGWR